jgi:hypothetical protein
MALGQGAKAIPVGPPTRPPVTARLTTTSGPITPILGRRRTAAAGAAVMPARDSSQPSLGRTRRAGALTRPTARGAA